MSLGFVSSPGPGLHFIMTFRKSWSEGNQSVPISLDMLKCNLVSSGPKGTKNEQSIGKVEKVLLRIHPKRAFERRESRKQIKPALKSILFNFLCFLLIFLLPLILRLMASVF